MRAPALEVVKLSKAFSTVRALCDVSLTIAEGAVVGLVGPNGAGKTTLFSLVAGFLRADQGEIRVFGQTRGSGKIASGTLSILPQDARFGRGVSIERLFLWYANLMGMEGEDAKKEVSRVLELVDLTDAAPREGSQLSHGMCPTCFAQAMAELEG